MYMNAEIEVKKNLQKVLPVEAIVGFEGKNTCLKIQVKINLKSLKQRQEKQKTDLLKSFQNHINDKKNSHKRRIHSADELKK